MSESYSDDEAAGAARGSALAEALIARLLPQADARSLTSALLAERARPPRAAPAASGDPVSEPARELRRVRRQFALGAVARTAPHELNNPLTALLAEAQLLELEPLAEEHRLAVGRIVQLARRIATVTRRFETVEGAAHG